MSHTKAKLKTRGPWIETEHGGHPVAYVGLSDIDKDDARRLVACWNACVEIPTEALEKEGDALCWITSVATRNRELREERDKLLILLRATAKYADRKPFNLTKEVDTILAKYPEGES